MCASFVEELIRYDRTHGPKRALPIRERTLGGGDPAVADELIQLARILMRQRRFETAGALLERALAIRQRNPDAPGPVVDATADQAELLSAQRRFTESEQTYRRALTLADERLTPDDPALATVVAGLATLLRETGRAAEAVALYPRAIDLSSAVVGESDPALVPVLRQQAAAYDQLGRAEEARGARALAEGILARVLGNDRSAAVQKRWEKLVAESITLFGQQEYGALVHNGRTAVEMAEALFGPNDYRVSVFLVLLGAQTGSGEGDYAHAEALFRRAVRIAERAVGTEDAGLAEALLNFARLYSQELKEQPAETMLLRAISIHERVMGLQTSEDPLMPSPRINLPFAYAQQGRLDEAESLLQHALAIVENGNGPKAPRQFATSQLLIALADLRERQRRYAEAEPLIRRAVDLASTTWGLGWGKVKNATIAGGLSDLAFVHVQEGRLADAERTY